jgi:hypothetical protein
MYARQIFIFTILLEFLTMVVCVEAAQFDGPNTQLPKVSAIEPENESHQFGSNAQLTTIQQNATNVNQAPISMLTAVNVEVASDVYSEKDRQVLYCPKGNYMVVRNRIFLTGADLDKVKQVKYLLHPSFSNPVAVSEDPTNDFEVWIWSWGGFLIKATITTKSGQVFEKELDFSFKTKFEEAQSKGIPQAMECNE